MSLTASSSARLTRRAALDSFVALDMSVSGLGQNSITSRYRRASAATPKRSWSVPPPANDAVSRAGFLVAGVGHLHLDLLRRDVEEDLLRVARAILKLPERDCQRDVVIRRLVDERAYVVRGQLLGRGVEPDREKVAGLQIVLHGQGRRRAGRLDRRRARRLG